MSDEWLVRHADDESDTPHIGTVMNRCPSGDPDYLIVGWWGRQRRRRYHYGDLVTIQDGLFGDDV